MVYQSLRLRFSSLFLNLLCSRCSQWACSHTQQPSQFPKLCRLAQDLLGPLSSSLGSPSPSANVNATKDSSSAFRYRKRRPLDLPLVTLESNGHWQRLSLCSLHKLRLRL